MGLDFFDIPRRSRSCVEGGEEFSQGVSYISLLKKNEKGDSLRKDYCLACWENRRQQEAGEIFWRSKVPLKPTFSDPVLRRNEQVLQWLKERHQSDQEEVLAEAFILAQLLARGRLLQLKQEISREGEKGFFYEVRATEEILFVKKVPLSAPQIVRMKELWIATSTIS